MAEAQPPKSVAAKEMQVPEWEHIAAPAVDGPEKRSERGSFGSRMGAKLDAVMPPHRRYLKMSRNIFLLVCAGIIIAILVLIIGLAAGLSHHGRAKNLPLPSNAETFHGDFTYFTPGLGACGEMDSSSDKIVAVSHKLFDAAGSSSSAGGNSNNNPLCGKMLRAQRYDEQVGAMRSTDLKVVDRCTGCDLYDLDTTESVFEGMAAIASGRVDVTWAWLQPVATGS